ncbi:hypothetical protein B0H14DRAFT_2382467 [Mycena olivaceomarginata]|nr:hypothetical protein B0H14DRAFT_2409754 [Mycena olivaceomarginata]KAJ7805723.1 hypothetical protein B0H14DRAFT_2382467 [Mycena olivaceomarginata]
MKYWSLDGGWIYSVSSHLLLWLPSNHRIGLWTPFTTLVIGAQQTKISFDNCVHGEKWKTCYSRAQE